MQLLFPSGVCIIKFQILIFSCIDKNTVLKEIRGLSTTKASQDTVLPVEILKENADYFAEFIYIQFNNSVNSSKFPSSFKCGNITPIFKNESRNHKRNYTPVSILPIVSKIFGKIMSNQLSTYSEKILLKLQGGFLKGFSTQHCLLLMLENGNMLSITKTSLELFSQIYRKHSTVYVIIC